MPRAVRQTINKLTATKVRTLTTPGKHADGGNGLYLRITPSKAGGVSKSWVFRYRFPPRAAGGGKQRDLGLGTPAKYNLETARGIVAEYWRMIERGEDPMVRRQAAAVAHESKRTYKAAAEKFIEAKRAGWHPRHVKAWERSLNKYCKPIAALPVNAITADGIASCLWDAEKKSGLWLKKPETADRVRQQIERVLDAATADGWRSGDNPARWRGSMEAKLPDRPRGARKATPRASLPYAELPAFLIDLRKQSGFAPASLEFQILTAVRPGEAAGARWDEIDLDATTWTIPGARMKMGEAHTVPLSEQAVALLRRLPRVHDNSEHVFPGGKKGRPLTTAAPMKVLKGVRPGLSAHGFRSTFRTWCAEVARAPRDIAEAALAHSIPGVEGDYNRAEFLAQRAELMQTWADHCEGKASGAEAKPNG
jgi:integrase